jgi:ABC-type spermidine/putrescine transport system permease subunit II
VTWTAALVASVLRSGLVAILGLCGANALTGWIESAGHQRSRGWRLALTAIPFLTPNLMVGYGYRVLSLNLLNYPAINETLYFSLVCLEVMPAAVWLLLNAPAPEVSREALYCAALVSRDSDRRWSVWRRFDLWRRGPIARFVAPGALLFLLSFQEAELAALMQVRSWTERIFTDHTRGLPALVTARLVAAPVVIELLCLWPLVRVIQRARTARRSSRRDVYPSVIGNAAAMGLIAAGLALVVGYPAVKMVGNVLTSGKTLIFQPMWLRELGDALLLALTCAGTAWLLAWGIGKLAAPSHDNSPMRRLVFSISLIPGLTGPLALGLFVAAAFQRFCPRLAYTPWPLVLAEVLWLWPRTVLVWTALNSDTRTVRHQLALLESGKSTSGSQAVALRWLLRGRPLMGGFLLVCWWSYLELMLPTVLAIPDFQPAPVLMYNHLHYGQMAALGVKLVMILAVPAIIAVVMGGVSRIAQRRLSS